MSELNCGADFIALSLYILIFFFVKLFLILSFHPAGGLQYKTCKDGGVLGVTVTRVAMLTHCQTLTQSCSNTEGKTHTCVQMLVRGPHPDQVLAGAVKSPTEACVCVCS